MYHLFDKQNFFKIHPRYCQMFVGHSTHGCVFMDNLDQGFLMEYTIGAIGKGQWNIQQTIGQIHVSMNSNGDGWNHQEQDSLGEYTKGTKDQSARPSDNTEQNIVVCRPGPHWFHRHGTHWLATVLFFVL